MHLKNLPEICSLGLDEIPPSKVLGRALPGPHLTGDTQKPSARGGFGAAKLALEQPAALENLGAPASPLEPGSETFPPQRPLLTKLYRVPGGKGGLVEGPHIHFH